MNIKITICCCRCASPSCSKRITSNDYMIVKSTGIVTFRDKNGPVQKREGPVYLHVLEGCMQNYFEDFAYNKVTIGADTMLTQVLTSLIHQEYNILIIRSRSLQETSNGFYENCPQGKFPPNSNSKLNPNPNPNPNRG